MVGDELIRRAEALLDETVNPSGLVDPLLPPLRDFLRRGGKGFRTRLVEVAYALGGGAKGSLDASLAAAVELLHAGSLIIDDIEDGSEMRRGAPTLHRNHGIPLALNTGNWLYFAALRTLLSSDLSPERLLRIQRDAMRTLLLCHQGQGLDLATRVDAVSGERLPAMVARITALKTAELTRFSAQLGAHGAGADDKRVDALAVFGFEMGVALQMLDDRSGIANPARADKGSEDLVLRRVTWPWAWAFDSHGEAFVQGLQRDLRRGAPAETLRAALAAAIEGCAREAISAQLRRTRDKAARCADEAGLSALDAELARLETAYG